MRTLQGQTALTVDLFNDLRKLRQHMMSHQQHPAGQAGASLMTAICAGDGQAVGLPHALHKEDELGAFVLHVSPAFGNRNKPRYPDVAIK